MGVMTDITRIFLLHHNVSRTTTSLVLHGNALHLTVIVSIFTGTTCDDFRHFD